MPPSSSDGGQKGMSNTANIHSESSRKESKTASSTLHQFSAISAHSSIKGTPTHIREWLMSSPQDSPASLSHSQDVARQQMTNETNGLRPWRQYAESVQPFASLKTFEDCSAPTWITAQTDLFTTTERFCETYPRAGMMLDGALYQQPMLERITFVRESGLSQSKEMWPTPTTQDSDRSSMMAEAKYNIRTNRKSLKSEVARRDPEFPTPNTADAKFSFHHTPEKLQERKESGRQFTLAHHVMMYPTPTVDDAGNATLPKSQVTRDNIPGALLRSGESPGGMLNPEFVEWLMGWPIGHTGLQPLEMEWYLQWLQQHGMY